MLLTPITERVSYLPGSNNLGVVTTGDGGAVAIDTGLDKDTGRALRKALDEAHLSLRAIISTHHHTDHVGGNDYLLRNIPGVEVYAPATEAALIANPLLEPVYLSMGARPPTAFQTKWLLSKGSPVHHLIEGEQLNLAGLTFEVLALPGHSINQIGVAIEGVCFAADGYFGTTILEKHGIPYAHDIAAQLTSLDTLAARNDAFFLPGHGDLLPRDGLATTIQANRSAIERGSAAVRVALEQPGDVGAVAARVAKLLGLTITNLAPYAIFASAVSAHLSYLESQGRARLVLDEAGMLWTAS